MFRNEVGSKYSFRLLENMSFWLQRLSDHALLRWDYLQKKSTQPLKSDSLRAHFLSKHFTFYLFSRVSRGLVFKEVVKLACLTNAKVLEKVFSIFRCNINSSVFHNDPRQFMSTYSAFYPRWYCNQVLLKSKVLFM